jgi:hypothetical protein
LEKSFCTQPELANLIKGYQLVDQTSDLTLQDFENLVQDQTDTSYTFIAWIEGCTVQPSLIVYHPDTRNNSLASATYKKQPIVLTRDYYNYLKATQSLVITNIKAILFFRTEPTFNTVYQRLIEERANARCPIQVAWIKRLVNLSCGFFGIHSGRKQFKFILTNKLPRTYHFSRHRVDVNFVEDLTGGDEDSESSYFLLETTHRAPKFFRRKNALAIFVTVVETGKLRLMQIIQFIAHHLSPQNWSLVYSNIDNLIIAVRGGASLDEAILATAEKSTVQSYLAKKPNYLLNHPGQAKPGIAKLKWLCNIPNWEFITMTTQHYALVTDDEEKDVHKSSGWSSLSNR